jgi:hypothetical protein
MSERMAANNEQQRQRPSERQAAESKTLRPKKRHAKRLERIRAQRNADGLARIKAHYAETEAQLEPLETPLERTELRSRGRKRAPVRPGTQPAKQTKTHSGGRPGFVPTPSERRFVQAMAGLRMSADEICQVIGAGRNRDGTENVEDTGRTPISKATLYKHFRNELANGRAMLKARVAGRFYNALDEDQPWAIQMAMRNQFGWDNGRSGFQISLLDEGGDGTEAPAVSIQFVLPGKQLEDEPIRDVTPSRVEQQPRRDYASEDHPVIDVAPNRPTSVPITGKKRGFDWS